MDDGIPPAAWADAWAKLRSRVGREAAQGRMIDPGALLAYLDRLQADAVKPVRQWARQAASTSSWLPASPDGLPPKSYPHWTKWELERRRQADH